MSLTRFMIADNPMVAGSTSAIIHTVEPQSIIELIEGHRSFKTPFRYYSFKNVDGITEDWTLRVHHLFTQEFDSEKHHIIVTKLLDRAWNWYKAYMN